MIARGPRASAGRRVPASAYVVAALAGAILLGILAGMLFARHQLDAAPHLIPSVPGEFAPPAPRPVGVPSTPVPMPSATAAIGIGFLDEQRDVAVQRRVITTKVGTCVVARVQPKRGSAYRRLVGGERWAIGGAPGVSVRAGDAPGFCMTWNEPSGKAGFPVSASAVVADDAGEQALGSGSARVIVTGTPKPKPQSGSHAKHVRHGASKPQPQATQSDQ